MNDWEGNIYEGGSSDEHMLDLSPKLLPIYDAAVDNVLSTVLVSGMDMLSIYWRE